MEQPSSILRLHLVGANPNPKIAGLDELPGKVNYFLGHDPSQWRANDAPIGASITITGANFSASAASNLVWFGAVRATVTSATRPNRWRTSLRQWPSRRSIQS